MTYESVHREVAKRHGRAKIHSCRACGRRAAADWAYDHKDPDQLTDSKGRKFSPDVERYEPLCRQCHRSHDINVGQLQIAAEVIDRSCETCGATPGDFCRRLSPSRPAHYGSHSARWRAMFTAAGN